MSQPASVTVAWDTGEPSLPAGTLERAVAAALEHGGQPALRLDLVVVDDRTLAELHGRFLDDPSPTDVIAFDLRGEEPPLPGDPGPDGELYLSLDCARRLAGERGVTLERELCLYAVHGALHLCGFDDHEPEERERMRVAELVVLRGLGYEDDPLPHE